MADTSGGQLTFDGTSGPFHIVTDPWWPEDDALTPLWFGLDLEGDDTQVGLGDYILNPVGWAPTIVQIPMWFAGHIDHEGVPHSNVIEGFESNLNYWRTELLDPTVVARTGTLTMPSGESRTATASRFKLSGRGRKRPAGWPLMFEFRLTAPFAPEAGS